MQAKIQGSGDFEIVARNNTGELIDELELTHSALFDQKTTPKLGYLKGAQFIITTTFSGVTVSSSSIEEENSNTKAMLEEAMALEREAQKELDYATEYEEKADNLQNENAQYTGLDAFGDGLSGLGGAASKQIWERDLYGSIGKCTQYSQDKIRLAECMERVQERARAEIEKINNEQLREKEKRLQERERKKNQDAQRLRLQANEYRNKSERLLSQSRQKKADARFYEEKEKQVITKRVSSVRAVWKLISIETGEIVQSGTASGRNETESKINVRQNQFERNSSSSSVDNSTAIKASIEDCIGNISQDVLDSIPTNNSDSKSINTNLTPSPKKQLPENITQKTPIPWEKIDINNLESHRKDIITQKLKIFCANSKTIFTSLEVTRLAQRKFDSVLFEWEKFASNQC
jgi:hypothetical protein